MVILAGEKYLRSFGRLRGRSLGVELQRLEQEVLPHYLWTKMNPSGKNYLEIGSGSGEALVTRANADRDGSYIGCEVYQRGVLSLLRLILATKLDNVRIFYGDAHLLLEQLALACLRGIFVFFPDPWFKRKHHKRRILTKDFLKLLIYRLEIEGKLFFASDVEDYAIYLDSLVRDCDGFQIKLATKIKPIWWVDTKYYQKALVAGRNVFFRSYQKFE
jgi:tRNA (guanine-N7-)-methyltransferase